MPTFIHTTDQCIPGSVFTSQLDSQPPALYYAVLCGDILRDENERKTLTPNFDYIFTKYDMKRETEELILSATTTIIIFVM